MAIGKSVPMLDSLERVTGALDYLVNLQLPNMLQGRIVRSAVPHARLLELDISAAQRVKGIAGILTRADFNGNGLYGVAIPDQGVVALDRVRFLGEPVAVIAAEDTDALEEASARIDIDYDELPAVFDAREAIRPGAPTLHDKFPDNIFARA